jgi:hypothetical protein
MKTLKYITVIAAVMMASWNYVAAQEYDDLYYDPNNDTSVEQGQQD